MFMLYVLLTASLYHSQLQTTAQSTTPSPSVALATCNPTVCKPSSLPCSSNLDCECFSLTSAANGTISGICAVADLSCTSVVRCNSDNVTCSIAHTICVNSTRCQQPVCYPMALANIQICPPNAITSATLSPLATTTSGRPNLSTLTTSIGTNTTVVRNSTIQGSIATTNSSTTTMVRGTNTTLRTVVTNTTVMTNLPTITTTTPNRNSTTIRTTTSSTTTSTTISRMTSTTTTSAARATNSTTSTRVTASNTTTRPTNTTVTTSRATATLSTSSTRSTTRPPTTSSRSTTTATTTSTGGVDLPLECIVYTTIDDSTRVVSNNIRDNSQACDRELFYGEPTPIRFVSPGGTQMPTISPGGNNCGTWGTGWLTTSHPSEIGQSVDGTVCYDYGSGNVCVNSNSIQITNCGGYYVYQVYAPPECNSRYCTVEFPNQCTNYTTINDPSRLVSSNGGSGCDNSSFSTGITYVRFVSGSGKDMEIAMSSPGPNHCGTQATGYVTTDYPYFPSQTVNATVCYANNNTSCYASNTITISYCDQYYVFGLTKPPRCPARYCTMDLPIQCYNYITINDPTRLSSNGGGSSDDTTLFPRADSISYVRFMSPGGTQILGTPIEGINRCGIGYPIYIDTTSTPYPSSVGETVNATTCMYVYYSPENYSPCYASNTITITNCSTYYVFGLTAPPALGPSRYCTVDLPSQCYSYLSINDSTRSISNLVNGTACDQSLFTSSNISAPTFVRFISSNGKILSSVPGGSNKCGTSLPGWTSATFPTNPGDTVDATVCYQYLTRSCYVSNPITITNCDTFYVFGLTKPPRCPARYCTD
ncbi:unnamed protein product [Rotaria sordida]|uniref:UMOD/GP2/OIT3-like D8C domain-containing protein n=1 Tax=Rotaria sordida TaxID=392033 RepID=A0A815FQK9_9BILA|nr:unnamed protein product [Rotaria sordida]